jgi:hypothetical protein
LIVGRRRARFAAAGGWLAAVVALAAAPLGAEAAPAAETAPSTSAGSSSGEPSLRMRAEGASARVELTGLAPQALAKLAAERRDARQWASLLALRVADSRGDAPPMLGTYRVAGDRVEFAPRFPLRPGVEYRAVFDPAGLPGGAPAGSRPLEATLTMPRPATGAPTSVAAVYPSADELPENLLKFYIHFTAPMSRGDSYRHLRIVDDDGREVPDAMLEIGEELWSADGRRLTVLFDPGRIKRGLRPREELGPPLAAGRRYTLVVSREWRDASGAPLESQWRREFRVVEPDDKQPDPARWRLAPPAAGARDPLVVEFDEPLDHALLERVIGVVGPAGEPLAGAVEVGPGETSWSFRPDRPWPAGRCRLIVDAALEDRAGNSVGRPFEVDGDAAQGRSSDEPRELPFDVN